MSSADKRSLYYPALLKLQSKKCVVIGGGRIALRKLRKLLNAGADITVISPTSVPEIEALAGADRITLCNRVYQRGDLAGADLSIAATNDNAVNQAVHAEAAALGQWVNVVDNPDLCTFIVPAELRLGDVQITISTSGTSPSTAKQLRDLLAQDLAEGTRRFQDLLLRHSRGT